jgi:hypothetical protein
MAKNDRTDLADEFGGFGEDDMTGDEVGRQSKTVRPGKAKVPPALGRSGAGRKLVIRDSAPEKTVTTTAADDMVRLADLKSGRVMDNLGVRVERSDGNRLKYFCALNRFSLGEGIKVLLDHCGVKPDGSSDL